MAGLRRSRRSTTGGGGPTASPAVGAWLGAPGAATGYGRLARRCGRREPAFELRRRRLRRRRACRSGSRWGGRRRAAFERRRPAVDLAPPGVEPRRRHDRWASFGPGGGDGAAGCQASAGWGRSGRWSGGLRTAPRAAPVLAAPLRVVRRRLSRRLLPVSPAGSSRSQGLARAAGSGWPGDPPAGFSGGPAARLRHRRPRQSCRCRGERDHHRPQHAIPSAETQNPPPPTSNPHPRH